MRSINGAVLRSAFAMVLGFVLVLWPEAAITYLVITIGILFILPGLFAILSYFTRPKNENGEKPMFPIEAAGSVLFGAWLVIMPEFFVNILMYLLGALLVIAGVQQLVSLISARKWSNVPLGFYLMPALILVFFQVSIGSKMIISLLSSKVSLTIQIRSARILPVALS